MLTLLVAVDGSAYSDRALDYAMLRAANSREPVELRLLNVQLPLAGVNVKLFISAESQQEYSREEGLAGPARPCKRPGPAGVAFPPPIGVGRPCKRLEQAGIACQHHIGVGDPGQVIADYACSTGCSEVVMGTQGRGALAGAVMGSVAQKVVKLSPVPVVLVK